MSREIDVSSFTATSRKYKWVKNPFFPDDDSKRTIILAEDGTNYRTGVNLNDTEGYLYRDYKAWLDAGNTPEAAD